MALSTRVCHTASTTEQLVLSGTFLHTPSVSLFTAASTTISHQRESMSAQNTSSTATARRTSSPASLKTRNSKPKPRPKMSNSHHSSAFQPNQRKHIFVSQRQSKLSASHHIVKLGKFQRFMIYFICLVFLFNFNSFLLLLLLL
ncbi:hypothetical protein TRFO_30787 [Tritrichomonas foetus]|uniref:Uncharacterized protein n=1 Tax=Tritrichomonas foetus TaxID=1144522 RepID=A0A1J4JSW2_9EUKA|nr:hypothetical protein TRFO_30787 [Tritrichomonas foetus]|eukprot:OHT02215.1 hypothetical protein TRFO_30787 [Tritrichomonas foetus]